MAAGHCLGLLAEHFGHHTASELAAALAAGAAADEQHAAVKQEPAAAGEGPASEGPGALSGAGSQPHLLSFASFNVRQVLSQGTPMLASGGEVRAAAPALGGMKVADCCCTCCPAALLPVACCILCW